MKKKVLIIIGVIILVILAVVGVVTYIVINKLKSASNDIQNISTDLNSAARDLQNGTDNTSNSLTGDTSGDASVTGTTGASYACSILTPAIAQQVLKGTVQVTSSEEDTSCTYTTDTTDMANFGVITLLINQMTPEQAKLTFDTAKTTTYENSTTDVTGLNADAAYYATNYEQLSILKGSNWIILTVSSPSYASGKDASIAAAKLILDKIN